MGRSGCASDRPGNESFLSLLLVVLTMHKPANLSKPWLSHLQNGHNSDNYTSGGFYCKDLIAYRCKVSNTVLGT